MAIRTPYNYFLHNVWKYEILERAQCTKTNVRPTEILTVIFNLLVHFQKNGKYIPINNIRFGFSDVHTFNVLRIYFPFKRFIFLLSMMT